jgi:hypothetical protein
VQACCLHANSGNWQARLLPDGAMAVVRCLHTTEEAPATHMGSIDELATLPISVLARQLPFFFSTFVQATLLGIHLDDKHAN